MNLWTAAFIALVLKLNFLRSSGDEDKLTIVSKTHSAYLEKYRSYSDAIIMIFNVPDDTPFVSFKFEADDMDFSIFGCKERDVELYLKRGSPPVINPDNSKVPDKFLKQGRPEMHKRTFKSDKTPHYVNVSSPVPGSYFAAVYHPYTDPQSDGITQAGLTPMCSTFVDATLYALNIDEPQLVTEDTAVSVRLSGLKAYKFYVPEYVDHLLLTLRDVGCWCSADCEVVVKMQAFNVPYGNETIFDATIRNSSLYVKQVWVRESAWHYATFSTSTSTGSGSLSFSVHFYRNSHTFAKPSNRSSADLYKNAVGKSLRRSYVLSHLAYREYALVRLGNTDSFVYSFEMTENSREVSPLSLNLTSTDLTVLKFKLTEFLDVGGTMHFVVAYMPDTKRAKERATYVIIACVKSGTVSVPTWPNLCKDEDGSTSASQVILNGTSSNSSVLVPYPESGLWFVTLGLFCGAGECPRCDCPDGCRADFERCRSDCERQCALANTCRNCSGECETDVRNRIGCEGCDCRGNCRSGTGSCNASVVFDVGSYPCVTGNCGKHGKCTFSVAEGFVYTACMCTNNYKGWDCSDDSDASSFGAILLELLLLVLSNLGFLPVAYVAYKRGHRPESLVYFSTFFFSSFYHACDAGENVISFCLVRLSVLQFCDFYCGLFSIYVTLIAMASLGYVWRSVLQLGGAVLVAFGTAYDKTSLWVFLFPFLVGLVVVLGNWGRKWRKSGRMFPNRRYVCVVLPVGVAVVTVALVSYALLQTQRNYKYLHSMWHLLMAVGVLILLPDEATFRPTSLS